MSLRSWWRSSGGTRKEVQPNLNSSGLEEVEMKEEKRVKSTSQQVWEGPNLLGGGRGGGSEGKEGVGGVGGDKGGIEKVGVEEEKVKAAEKKVEAAEGEEEEEMLWRSL